MSERDIIEIIFAYFISETTNKVKTNGKELVVKFSNDKNAKIKVVKSI